jgi:hypothetical protein
VKIINHPSIIQASAVKIVDGCAPTRLVIRDEGGYHPYVVHKESMTIEGNELVHQDFYDGHYYHSLEAAKRDFNERTSGAYSL